MKQKINCVITDLDDTIWDWFEMWHSSFEPYLNTISKKTGVDLTTLKQSFKGLHQKYYTTEVSFAYKELDCLNDKQKELIDEKKKRKKSILHQYYSDKKKHLNTYEGVLDTLKELKKKGVLVIGFTESNSFFTKTRLKQLDMDGLFDCIYTPIGAGIPESVTRFYDESFWEPKLTEIRHLSAKDRKPDVEILNIILRDFQLTKENTIYIGDKLDRDIQMALDAGLTAVFANYGHGTSSEKYELLKEVTHWTDADVQREIKARESYKEKTIVPTHELEKSYKEILEIFDFEDNQNKLNLELLPNVIDTWSKVVDVQQHFNNISLKIRNLYLTVFTFIIAGLGYLLKEKITIQLFDYPIKLEFLFCFLGALIMYSFYLMDKYWYHKFLKGASIQAGFIETKWYKKFSEMGLSNAISKASNYDLKHKIFGKKSNSNRRFNAFYKPSILILFFLGVVFQFFVSRHEEGQISIDEHTKIVNSKNLQNKYLEEKATTLLKQKDSLIRHSMNIKNDLKISKLVIDSLKVQFSKNVSKPNPNQD